MVLLCNFCVRDPLRYQHRHMVFLQGKDEGDVVFGKLVMESNPVFPCAFPLIENRIVAVWILLLQALFHQATKGGHIFGKRGNEAVRQCTVHSQNQPVTGPMGKECYGMERGQRTYSRK